MVPFGIRQIRSHWRSKALQWAVAKGKFDALIWCTGVIRFGETGGAKVTGMLNQQLFPNTPVDHPRTTENEPSGYQYKTDHEGAQQTNWNVTRWGAGSNHITEELVWVSSTVQRLWGWSQMIRSFPWYRGSGASMMNWKWGLWAGGMGQTEVWRICAGICTGSRWPVHGRARSVL